MNDSDIRFLTDEVLGRLLKRFGFVGTDIRGGLDHFDEPSLFVTARLETSRNLSGRIGSQATVELHDALLSRGEQRFPYLSFDFLDEEAPYEPVAVASQ